MNTVDTAVIGAGVCGLTAARSLVDAGQTVIVLDKGRGPGGRSSTRTEGPWRFDHGAQYFTAQTAGFARQVAQWCQSGIAGKWHGRIVSLAPDDSRRPLSSATRRFLGVPGMNAPAEALAADLPCRFGTQVRSLARDREWRIETVDASFTARSLVVTLPAPQARSLLQPHAPGLADAIGNVTMAPCWALMLGLDEPFDPGFDGAFVNTGPLGWIASSAGKPGRDHRPTWIAHATDGWSREHLELSPEDARVALLAAFRRATGYAGEPAFCQAHRWRYARADRPLDAVCLSDPSRSVWLGGDWCAGSRVEGAWRSGRRIAEEILEGAA